MHLLSSFFVLVQVFSYFCSIFCKNRNLISYILWKLSDELICKLKFFSHHTFGKKVSIDQCTSYWKYNTILQKKTILELNFANEMFRINYKPEFSLYVNEKLAKFNSETVFFFMVYTLYCE